MQAALAQRGTHVSLRTVYRTMSEFGLIHRHRRPHGITKADTAIQDRENLIKRDFSAAAPLKKLLTDITEVQCSDGKLYVSPILDCFNGEIVALEMHDNMKKELCIDTIKQLREKYGKLEGTVLHSDRGCQYTSCAFRRELVTNGLIQSLSGTAHCYDNARMESFFATLKKEKLYQIPTYRMKREEVKTVIFRYIFGYYNTQRINSFNAGGLSPVALRTSTGMAHHAAGLLPIQDFGYSLTAHFLTIPKRTADEKAEVSHIHKTTGGYVGSKINGKYEVNSLEALTATRPSRDWLCEYQHSHFMERIGEIQEYKQSGIRTLFAKMCFIRPAETTILSQILSELKITDSETASVIEYLMQRAGI